MTERNLPSRLFVIAILILLVSSTGKVYINAVAELRQAEEFARKQSLSEAVMHFERAVHWYLPGSGIQDRAAEGLWAIARGYETSGDLENAINSYRLLRGALYATRSFFTPGHQWIALSDDKIAHIMAIQPAYSESDKAKNYDQRKAGALALLTAEKPPYLRGALVTELGFFGWVACVFIFIFRAMAPTGRVLSKPACFWAVSFVLFYSLWLLGMSRV